jgi:enoyl-CoA hydratase
MANAMSDVVSVASHGAVRLITLNRPDALNAANAELHGAVARVWSAVAEDRDARCVVVTGAGRAFCAGGDLDLLQAMADDEGIRDEILGEAALLVRGMLEIEIPIIAAVNGPAVGLGCSLASLCDLVLVGESAYFADPHVSIGLVAADGGAISWPLLTGLLRAKEHLLLGSRIDARTAVEFGLANRVVPDGDVVREALDVAKRIAALPPQAVAQTKRLLNAATNAAIATLLDGGLRAEGASFDTEEFRNNLARMRAPREK